MVGAGTLNRPARTFVAEMIGPAQDKGQGSGGYFVARDFMVKSLSPGTMLHITAQGLYRAFVNGRRVGEDLLTPGWTVYDDRLAYQSYDISSLLTAGANRIEVWLGDGWYRGRLMWDLAPVVNAWGDTIGVLAEIEQKGEVLLGTDPSWRSGRLPIVKEGIYFGEDYDARIPVRETDGVVIINFNKALLVPHETGAVKALAPRAPVSSWRDAEGRMIHDFGQNCGAIIRLQMRGSAGATVRVEHAEVLGPGNTFDNRNYRSARAELHYTLGGGDEEHYEPMFTFMGFRYARVSITGTAEVTGIEMVPITSVPELAGGFSSGEAAVNRLVENTIWSQRSNFIEVPTDCPQRDERLGWTGDAQVFAGTACWLADSQLFLKKYLRDVMADQRPDGAVPHFSPDPTRLHPVPGRGDWAGSTGWGDAITVIPWQLYLHYGDKGVLEECFPAMLRWLDYLYSISGGPIIRPHARWGTKGFTFGDWLQPIGDNRKPRPTIADDCAATIYHYISTDLAAKVAETIGNALETTRLRARAVEIRDAFQYEFFSPSGRIAHNDQTSWALAFLYGLVPAQYRKAGEDYFRKVVEDADGLIGTGFIGTPALLPALSELGLSDLAEQVFLNRKVPGWLYQVEQGATSIWERWDAIAEDGSIYDPDMNSYNHYAYGAVCQWLFEYVAGVRPRAEAPGFDEVILNPLILPKLNPVSAWHICRHGRIEAGWSKSGNAVTYTISLPEGVSGRLVPNPAHKDVRVNGGATEIAPEGLVLPAGAHEVTFTL